MTIGGFTIMWVIRTGKPVLQLRTFARRYAGAIDAVRHGALDPVGVFLRSLRRTPQHPGLGRYSGRGSPAGRADASADAGLGKRRHVDRGEDHYFRNEPN